LNKRKHIIKKKIVSIDLFKNMLYNTDIVKITLYWMEVFSMSRKSREKEKAKRQNSLPKRLKQQRKNYYTSGAAREAWDEKKASKKQSQISQREKQGINSNCRLLSCDKPSYENCGRCRLKCHFENFQVRTSSGFMGW
jgi:hypothetical protein